MNKNVMILMLCLIFVWTVQANATLTTIGTAKYNSADYKLIWDDDNNGNSVVWLDFTNAASCWDCQVIWALELGDVLSIHLDSSYIVTWDDPEWRLPSTGWLPGLWSYDDTTSLGYNVTTSEMGHLFYGELGNFAYYATDATGPQPGWGLANTGDFDNLMATEYWSDTIWGYLTYHMFVYFFDMDTGNQDIQYAADWLKDGLAVRGGRVSKAAATPIPAPILLLGTGLLGLIPLARKRIWD